MFFRDVAYNCSFTLIAHLDNCVYDSFAGLHALSEGRAHNFRNNYREAEDGRAQRG